MKTPRILTLIGMIIAAALMRIVPHPWNFTPLAAMALFSGAQFDNKKMAYAVPFLTLLVSDLLLGFHNTMLVVYMAFAIIVWLGILLKERQRWNNVVLFSLIGSVSFFFITNFGVWLASGLYPLNGTGLGECFVAAVPFFRNTVGGDLFYNAVLFGSFALLESRIPSLRRSNASLV